MKKRIIIYIIGALVLIGGVTAAIYYYQSNNKPVVTEKTQQKEVSEKIAYKGKDGVTALVLLEQNAKVETSDEGFIESINGYIPNSSKNEFWSFYINDEPSMEGAGTYITKDSDTITWKIDTF